MKPTTQTIQLCAIGSHTTSFVDREGRCNDQLTETLLLSGTRPPRSPYCSAYGMSKVKTLIATGELRSIKDGKYRRILPEWVDEYIARRARNRSRW